MHLFGSSRDRTPRFFAHFETPDNPVCWLTGHRPAGRVVESRYSDPWLLIRCRVCDRRYEPQIHRAEDYPGGPKALVAARIENFRRNPRQFLADIEKRGRGWGVGHLNLSFEASVPKKPRREFSLRLHTGTRGSESPYDAHLTVAGYGVYLGVGGVSGRWAEFIGRGHGRDLSLSTHGGQLWWKLWYDGDGGNDQHHRCDKWRKPALWPWSAGRRKYRPWMCLRDGNIELNPVSAWYGSRKYLLVEEGEPRQALVVVGQFPGDEYLVSFRLDRREVKREHGPKWARRVKATYPSIEWDAHLPGQPGIPVQNHDWKGDEILSGNLPASVLDGWSPESGEDWLPRAVAGLRGDVLSDRKRYQYRPPSLSASDASGDSATSP